MIPSLTPALQQLEAAQLIRALADIEHAYFFRHILIQESAYDTLLKQERRNLHHAIARVLDSSETTPPEELARHFAAAEDRARAIHYYTLAAHRAKSRFENAEAIAFFRAALREQIENPTAPGALRAQNHEGLGDVLALTGQTTAALAEYDTGLEYAPDALTRARLIRKKGDVYQTLLQFERTADTYAAAETALGTLDATQGRMRWQEWIWIQLGAMNNYYWHGHWQRVRELTDRTRSVVEQYGTPDLRATFLDRVEMMHARRNRYVMDDETRDLVVAMRAAAEESQDPRQILNARFSMAFVDLRRRDLDASENEFLWSIDRAQELGDVMYELWARTYLAVLYRWRGDVERTQTMVEASFRVQGAEGTPWYGAGMANLAWVALVKKDDVNARRLAYKAMEIWEPFGELYPFKTLALFPLLELARREGDPAEAVSHVRAILKPDQEKLPDALSEALTRAVQAFETGEMQAANLYLEEACEHAHTAGYV